MLIRLDLDRVRLNAREATTEDLLDRVTVYRAGMEIEALEIIEAELRARHVTTADIREHEERRRRETTQLPDGTAARCTFCYRPAIAEGWGWHRMWGLLPLFPRFFHYCNEHLPGPAADAPPEGDDPSVSG